MWETSYREFGGLICMATIGVHKRMIVYKKADFKCCVCGSSDNLTCDHFIPQWTRIVSNDTPNLLPMCEACNSAKGLQFMELAKLKYLPELYVQELMRYYRNISKYLYKYVRDFAHYRTNGEVDVEASLQILDSYQLYIKEHEKELNWEEF